MQQIIWIIAENLTVGYTVLYSLIKMAARYKQLQIDPDVYEEFQEIKAMHGSTSSDLLSSALQAMKKELAHRQKL